uniref:Uncharacterized protein n=1 Tax=Peronospora matthiolae TaxID=2874970 RepID=A0AAV1V6S4_9STRA
MTSCVIHVHDLPRRLHKRLQSSLPVGGAATEASSAPRDSVTSEARLKVCKRRIESSPRSAMTVESLGRETAVVTTSRSDAAGNVQWPSVTGCEGVRKALTFLRTSRQHALMLMLQNHWERAMGVLEKIEKATESVSEQRRQVVIKQANAGRNSLVWKLQELEVVAPQRVVRFRDEVAFAIADEMDRTCDVVAEPLREEMLVLRASRKIPQANLSEFWNE